MFYNMYCTSIWYQSNIIQSQTLSKRGVPFRFSFASINGFFLAQKVDLFNFVYFNHFDGRCSCKWKRWFSSLFNHLNKIFPGSFILILSISFAVSDSNDLTSRLQIKNFIKKIGQLTFIENLESFKKLWKLDVCNLWCFWPSYRHVICKIYFFYDESNKFCLCDESETPKSKYAEILPTPFSTHITYQFVIFFA